MPKGNRTGKRNAFGNVQKVRYPRLPKAVLNKILEEKNISYITLYRRMKVQNDLPFIQYVMNELREYRKMLSKTKSEIRKAAIADVFKTDDDLKWKGVPELLLRLPGEETKEEKSKRLIRPLTLSDLQ